MTLYVKRSYMCMYLETVVSQNKLLHFKQCLLYHKQANIYVNIYEFLSFARQGITLRSDSNMYIYNSYIQ